MYSTFPWTGKEAPDGKELVHSDSKPPTAIADRRITPRVLDARLTTFLQKISKTTGDRIRHKLFVLGADTPTTTKKV
jgi:hypothetical protein